MKIHTTICKVDVGQTLNDLKEEMLQALIHIENNKKPVFGIFNGELYVAYEWAKTTDDIARY